MQQKKQILISILAMTLTASILTIIAFKPLKQEEKHKKYYVIQQKTGITNLEKATEMLIKQDFILPLEEYLQGELSSTCLISYKSDTKNATYASAILFYDLSIRNCRFSKYCKLRLDLNKKEIKVYDSASKSYQEVEVWLKEAFLKI